MNAFRSLRLPLCALTALLSLGLGLQVSAQSVTTTPVGAVTLTIAAGTGAVKNATVVSFPLINSTVVNGLAVGSISTIGSNTITCATAGWTAGALAQASTPYLVKIISGSAAGRTFVINGNTSDTLTIATSDGVSSTPVNLVSLGVVNGDKFQIEDGDTILGLFGAGVAGGVGGPLGNANPNLADTIQLNIANSYQTFYYDPAQTSWINAASEALSNNVIVRPDTAIIYNRIANSAYTITVTGSVPNIPRKAIVRSGQNTILSSFWPVNLTLGGLGLNTLPGWVSNANPNVADTIQMRVGSSWKTCYHDGANWIDLASEGVANSYSIPAGSGLTIRKRAVTGEPVSYTNVIPYSL